ncbi:MAG: hypothetical protein SFU56_22035 [Capsulimonadales bacterium]|nr:hypothetical protein [Capsulimonadales bacterium]
MAYSVTSKKNGTVYYLHAQTTQTKGGRRTLYFFRKELKEGALDQLPDGYIVTESESTGLPLLSRSRGDS